MKIFERKGGTTFAPGRLGSPGVAPRPLSPPTRVHGGCTASACTGLEATVFCTGVPRGELAPTGKAIGIDLGVGVLVAIRCCQGFIDGDGGGARTYGFGRVPLSP